MLSPKVLSPDAMLIVQSFSFPVSLFLPVIDIFWNLQLFFVFSNVFSQKNFLFFFKRHLTRFAAPEHKIEFRKFVVFAKKKQKNPQTVFRAFRKTVFFRLLTSPRICEKKLLTFFEVVNKLSTSHLLAALLPEATIIICTIFLKWQVRKRKFIENLF